VAIGLALGLLVAAFTWKSGLTARRALRREVARARAERRRAAGQPDTQLKISATGSRQVLAELEELRARTITCVVNLAQFNRNPPCRIRQLHILEAAARRCASARPASPGMGTGAARAEEESQRPRAASGSSSAA
jgi:hypothetical protein